jgi:DNA-binding CsgD family transcriptional regulator
MNSSKTCICVRSALIASGLTHYIHSVSPTSTIEVFKTVSELMIVNKLASPIIFIDLQILTPDSVLIIEKIKNMYSSCILIGLSDRQINDRLLPYFDHILLSDDFEPTIVNTLRSIYQPEENFYSPVDNIQVISERESEILKYVALGLTNKEISKKLNISIHTVITHRKNITFKLGIKTIAGLTVYAILKGIITAEEVHS